VGGCATSDDGLSDGFAEKLLAHRNLHVRRWTVRLLGDENKVTPTLANKLIELAQTELDAPCAANSRALQNACRPKRAWPSCSESSGANLDGQGPAHSVVSYGGRSKLHAVVAIDQIMETFATPVAWKVSLVKDAILPRLMRRYAAEGNETGVAACSRLLASTPVAERGRMLAALDQA